MPRAKRPLEKSDANAAEPAMKRSTRSGDAKNVDAARETESAPSDPPAANTRAANGKSADNSEINAPKPAPKKSSAKGRKGAGKGKDNAAPAPQGENVEAQSAAAEEPSTAQPAATASSDEAPWPWVTVARMNIDRRRERRGKDDEEPSEEEINAAKVEFEKYNAKPLSEHPDWPWRVSKPARKMAAKYAQDVDKRDPDIFGMYIYNDYHGYGTAEVIENMLLAWTTEYQKKDSSVWELWKHTEAIAHFFALMPELIGFGNLEDGERVNEILNVIGLALLSTLNKLEAASLLKPDGPVKDLELVLCLMLDFCSGYDVDFEDVVWPHQVVAYANKAGLKLDKLHNMRKDLERYSEDKLDKKKKDLVYSAPKEDKFEFNKKWKAYVSKYGIKRGGKKTVGGEQYDITKMRKAERIKHSFDKEDPMDKMVIEGTDDEDE
ncbi:hypothetical protein W97_08186 [Coniosporium apollinis CBS 100218]|uniref:Uncharacterized protein n=1 Tax=Coniosporium apollinis (strain CBS 100218) TaxID=1168221 RepID=R7Z497_CONA1|nr:uncharacterized protein W97_08186 [Coniosporium apollinis CBS 100218]EON68928.1 hypothetical protein W97_08186 [Coniosporium apollinis CBS 100218]